MGWKSVEHDGTVVVDDDSIAVGVFFCDLTTLTDLFDLGFGVVITFAL